jgi:hypothetical protein
VVESVCTPSPLGSVSMTVTCSDGSTAPNRRRTKPCLCAKATDSFSNIVESDASSAATDRRAACLSVNYLPEARPTARMAATQSAVEQPQPRASVMLLVSTSSVGKAAVPASAAAISAARSALVFQEGETVDSFAVPILTRASDQKKGIGSVTRNGVGPNAVTIAPCRISPACPVAQPVSELVNRMSAVAFNGTAADPGPFEGGHLHVQGESCIDYRDCKCGSRTFAETHV